MPFKARPYTYWYLIEVFKIHPFGCWQHLTRLVQGADMYHSYDHHFEQTHHDVGNLDKENCTKTDKL